MNFPFLLLSAALLLVFLSVAWAGCGGDDGTPSPDATPVPPATQVTRGTAVATPSAASPTPVPTPLPTLAASGPTPSPVAPTTAAVVDTSGGAPRGPAGPSGTSGPTGTESPGATTSLAALPTPAPMAAEAVSRESDVAAAPAAMPASAATPAPGPTPVPAAEAMSDPEDHSSDSGEPYQPASLSAGEVDDNERWEEYQRYLADYEGPLVHSVDVSERYIIIVTNSAGQPVPNALVTVSVGDEVLSKGRTYADGRTLFFPSAQRIAEEVTSFDVSVEKGGVGQILEFDRGEDGEWQVTLDAESSYDAGVPLDVLFLLDSTGSMADEIDQIKRTLLSISARIADLPSQPDLRFGMVSYRDRGDEYITRLYDFDADVGRFSGTIRNVVADGGGDTPESLNEALHVAVQRPGWRSGDAVRLVFLLADAPPHLDYQDDFNYAVEMVDARTRGIKIFSVASSGLDAQGEYIFRQIAQHTMGRFIFLLYPGYGEGLGTSHSVSEFTVERLDDLIVRLIEEELAALDG